jgi:hypothetical protein
MRVQDPGPRAWTMEENRDASEMKTRVATRVGNPREIATLSPRLDHLVFPVGHSIHICRELFDLGAVLVYLHGCQWTDAGPMNCTCNRFRRRA